MEFWGVEVKPGESLKYDPGSEKYVHLSQAAIGEVKKDKTSDVLISVKVDDQKVVLGTLAPGRCPQISFDVVFNKEFELSHNGKSSVYFCGYKTLLQDDDFCHFITSQEFSDSDADSEDDQLAPLALNAKITGKPDGKVAEPKLTIEKANAAKPESSVTKAKGKVAEPAKAEKAKEDDDDDDDDDDNDDDDEEDESGSDEDMVNTGDEIDDDEDEEDEDSSEEEETSQKVEIEKKRPQESATKTPVPAKKAKLVTPPGKKTGADGKKTTHTPTPYPKKTVAKTSAEGDKSKQQTPKSAGQFACKPCNRSFNSENALQSHNKAKHS